MVEMKSRRRPPHLDVRLTGYLSLDGISPYVEQFEHALGRMPADFTLLVDSTELKGFDRHVSGVFVYLTRRVLDLEPSALIYITGGQVVDAWMRNRLERLDEGGVMHFFDTRAEADAFIRSRLSDG